MQQMSIAAIPAASYPAAATLTTPELVDLLTQFNAAYRRGPALVSDAVYDHEYRAELARRDPAHPFLQQPEPEELSDRTDANRFKHSVAMLSTSKAFTSAEVAAWCARVTKACAATRIDPSRITIRITAKLDGAAARRYPEHLVTRGKNGFGTDISNLLTQGLVCKDETVDVVGEIVVEQAYFCDVLVPAYGFDHPRSYIAGLIGADTLKEHHLVALAAGKVIFQTYRTLEGINTTLDELPTKWEEFMDRAQEVPFLCDGAIAEVVADEPGTAVIAELGSTTHHHNWVIALKRNSIDEQVDVTVTHIEAAAARTGRITPTAMTEPTRVCGVMCSSYTTHHVRNLLDQQIGVGAVIRVTRSGGVIPTILSVIKPAKVEFDTEHCPSCGGATEWDGPYLVCPNKLTCVAQASASLAHFFRTIAVCRGFGPAVCDQLVAAGITKISTVYSSGVDGLVKAGISRGVATNLQSELDRSRSEPLSDAVFLGAFGLRHLGRGDSAKVLKHVPIEQIGGITAEQLMAIDGFGAGTSGPIAKALAIANDEIQAVLAFGFNLERTPRGEVGGVLAGKTIVFTGTMASGDRRQMEDNARKLGATVGSSVTGKTTWLVCGTEAGGSKTDKAAKLKIAVLTEADYLAQIAQA